MRTARTSFAQKSDIIVMPHDSLRLRSTKVNFITDEVTQLVEDMCSATLDWEASREHEVGVALAAVQINELSRVVVIREDFNDKTNQNFQILINPQIVKLEGELVSDYEGCLSVKDVYGKVPRYTKVRVKALNIEGAEIRIKAEGFLARVLQHEIDHTNGKLFVDHIKSSPESFYKLHSEGQIEAMTNEERKDIYSILW